MRNWIRRLWLCKIRKRHEFGPQEKYKHHFTRATCQWCGYTHRWYWADILAWDDADKEEE